MRDNLFKLNCLFYNRTMQDIKIPLFAVLILVTFTSIPTPLYAANDGVTDEDYFKMLDDEENADIDADMDDSTPLLEEKSSTPLLNQADKRKSMDKTDGRIVNSPEQNNQ